MINKEIDFFSKSVDIKITCPKCGKEIDMSGLFVPIPNFEAENFSSSIETEHFYDECDCGNQFSVILGSGFGSSWAEISDFCNLLSEDNIIIESDSYEDFYDESIDYHEVFNDHLDEVISVINKSDGLDDSMKSFLYKMVFANIYSCIEDYLYRTLMKLMTSSSPDIKNKFAKTYLKKECDGSKIDGEIITYLQKIVYHRFRDVKGIYKEIFGLKCGKTELLFHSIEKRHDIVHRNGKNKSGDEIVVQKEEILELAREVSDFIYELNSDVDLYFNQSKTPFDDETILL